MRVFRRWALANPLFAALGALALLGALAACQSAGESLGMAKPLPDEYAVSVGPNLAVPPDIDLRPPAPGEPEPDNQAAGIVFGEAAGAGAPAAASTPTNLSAGEYALLVEAKAVTTNGAIREVLGDGTGAADAADEAGAGVAPAPAPVYDPETDQVLDNFFDDLAFWEGAEGDRSIADDTVIDPAREAERLKQNAAQGKPANEGATPVLKGDEPGQIEDVP